MSCKNVVNPAFNNDSDFRDNEAKIKCMKFKNQDVHFFKLFILLFLLIYIWKVKPLPHFDCDSPLKEKEIKFDKADSCPTKKLNFFKNAKNSFNQRKNFNSYLFKNK